MAAVADGLALGLGLAPAGVTRLSSVDLVVVAAYLVGITLFGLRFRGKGAGGEGKDRSLRQYFLAGRTIPWWAIGLSIVSAETSTLTIISIPGVAFAGDFGFLQVVMGYMLGRVVVALLFLPKYFQGELMTAYQLIDSRFGPALHKVTALLFLLTRAAAEGVRVFAVSIVVGIAIGTQDVLSIAIITLLTLAYTFEGGMAAVIWTDVVQMALYVGGTVVAIFTLSAHVPGGWAEIHRVAGAAGRFHLFHFALNLTQAYTFWAGVVGGTFLTMASHGTDQLMVQRMLAARNLRESRMALLGSGVVIFVQFTLFLLIGAGLFVFYGMHPAQFASADRIFPTFIVREMPRGIAGLLVAAILAAAMSNLSAALNSLSSTTVVDFYMRWRPGAEDRERMLVSRASTVMWALVLFAIAVYSVHAGGHGHVVEVGLSIAAVAYGALLGVFLLGTLTKFANQWGAIVGMVVGFALNLALWLQPKAMVLGGITVPKVAFTWYVLIGAAVTFAVGAVASLLFRRKRVPVVVAMVLVLGLVAASAVAENPRLQGRALESGTQGSGGANYDFSPVSAVVEAAIEANKLPGAVVVVGHGGRVVFEQAYGSRAVEPAVEPMTKETIFDMASLSKCLVTATAVMQLVDAGKVNVDAPVASYLPAFAANGKGAVTVRELLTHYSGLAPDVDLKDAWGLRKADKAEGIRRAMEATLESAPGTKFEYSDINYITLQALVEKVSGERLQDYAQRHIFKPLGMVHTTYLPPARLIPEIAPTEYDEQLSAAENPDFGRMLRGVVHDPTTRRMGGVAGQAGVFSTAADTSLFAQGLLDRLAGRPSRFPLSEKSLLLMTMPEQPKTAVGGATIFTQDGQVTKGVAARGFGWDINSAFSRPRGAVFPIGSFGHTGFTGTSLWMDPGSDTYVMLLSNAVHPRGRAAISGLRGEVATAAARSLGVYPKVQVARGGEKADPSASLRDDNQGGTMRDGRVLTGIDVLEADGFAELKALAAGRGGRLRVGLLTNQTGLDAAGRRTIDVLRGAGGGIELTTLFSPEHGIAGAKDSFDVKNSVDAATGLPVISLYGAKDADRRPKLEDLKKLDAVVIDLQDAGVRFYTYETVVGYFLEAAAKVGTEVVVFDRPDPIGGLAVQGPVSDAGSESYIDYRPLPVRHGMTLGEVARFENGEGRLGARLTVVAMQGWRRGEYFDETGLRWVNPSPNLRSMAEATLYPGLGMLDAANVSVGRGTATPFEHLGAAYIHGQALATYLNARGIAGVRFEATRFRVEEDGNKYPFHGTEIEGVAITLTDRGALDAPELGVELIAALHRLYPAEFKMEKTAALIVNQATMETLAAGKDPKEIGVGWGAGLAEFSRRREEYLLYR
ncbi:MAG TPA: sodium/solute symporter [Granulicella sp.]|nr:sodium/solute symporter [Granulicella sp.]